MNWLSEAAGSTGRIELTYQSSISIEIVVLCPDLFKVDHICCRLFLCLLIRLHTTHKSLVRNSRLLDIRTTDDTNCFEDNNRCWISSRTTIRGQGVWIKVSSIIKFDWFDTASYWVYHKSIMKLQIEWCSKSYLNRRVLTYWVNCYRSNGESTLRYSVLWLLFEHLTRRLSLSFCKYVS
jgi:hypothetical protein